MMYTVGILERGRRLSSFLAEAIPDHLLGRIDFCSVDNLPRGVRADVLVVSPDVHQQAEIDGRPACRVLLVPGRLAWVAGEIDAAWAVSYGISPKDSLTLSSLGEDAICLALQREVVTLTGGCLECQEFLLPRGSHKAPCHVLACAGLQLLLGVPPEQVTVRAVTKE